MSHVVSLAPQDQAIELQKDALVLYRSEAAFVLETSTEKQQLKILLQTQSGKKVRVRPKDIFLLGAAGRTEAANKALNEMTQPLEALESGNIQEGWQLLQELQELKDTCSLADLAEAVFDGTGPRELYNAFTLINETPYFKGSPNAIVVRSSAQVQEEQLRKQKKQQEAEAWQEFYQHCQSGHFAAEDQPFIQEIEAIAYGEKQSCRLFRETKLEATPESAHEWLLRQGIWQERHNPYLRRNQIPEQALELTGPSEPWAVFMREFCAAMPELEASSQESIKASIKAPTKQLIKAPVQEPVPSEALAPLKAVLAAFCQSLPLAPLEASGPRPESPPAQSAGQSAAQAPALSWQTAERRNLTQLHSWAIDDPWSDDPDDAISIEEGESPSLWIHIADPASVMPYDCPLAQQALERAASVYVPERTYSMLPKDLLAGLGLGLQPVNMALSVQVRLSTGAKSLEVLDLCRSWVRVQRLSYDEADAFLEQDADCDLGRDLQRIGELCRAHEALRRDNNAIQFNMYNTKIVAEQPIQIAALPNTASRNLVAEAMLMAGAGMAEYAHQHQVAMPYLSQSPPKDSLPALDSLANMFAARKLLSPSSVHTEPAPHNGIGLAVYARASSPLRRYLDLLGHQQLHALLLQKEAPEEAAVRPLNQEELLYKMAQAEMQLSRINNAQRCSQQHWQMLYLKQEGKQRRYKAVVLGLQRAWQKQGARQGQKQGNRVWCSLPEIGLETAIVSKDGLQANQELEVVLKSVHLCRREAQFQIV